MSQKIKENHDFKGPLVDLHPDSKRYLNAGHPWITEDRYSKKFPDDIRFILGPKNETDPFVFLNTPDDKKIKARLIGRKSKLAKSWEAEIQKRLKLSCEKRKEIISNKDRDNFYLVFSESDGLPGLKILFLKNVCVLQYLIPYWSTWTDFLCNEIKKLNLFDDISFVEESRFQSARKAKTNILKPDETPAEFALQEFGINYQIKLDGTKDYGLFTDMSSIRTTLKPYFQSKESFLNLFCFTGAYSFYALDQGVKRVVSVDLSDDHVKWLYMNKDLNPQFSEQDHEIIKKNALHYLRKSSEQHDLILVDPPTLITDGKKTLNTLKFYQDFLEKMSLMLSTNGILISFCHIHHMTMRQVKQKLEKIIDNRDLPFRLKKKFTLRDDCKPLQGFPEGAYLKCLVFEKVE